MNLQELTRPLRRGLAGLRRRVRSLLLVHGVSRSLVVLVSAFVVFFLADYALRLPLWVRGIALLACLAGTGLVVFRRLLRPLATPLDDARLAARVEAAHPELQDRLKSSLAFSRATDDPDNEDSPELMRVVVEETVRRTGTIRFRQVARSGIAGRWAVTAAALLLGVAGAAFGQSELVSTFVQRSLLLRDVAWPRRTTLVVDGMQPGEPRKVTRGRETTVKIRAQGSIPDRVEFAYWEANAKRRQVERVELAPTAEDPALFAMTLPIYASYEFTVSGGDDDRREVYSIVALTPPAVVRIEMNAEYPEYLEKLPETLAGGDQRLPQGTRVRLDVHTNMELARAMLAIGSEDPREIERKEPKVFTTELTADKDVRYSIRLIGSNGEENDPGIDTFILRVAPDHAPSVRVHTPGARTERMPGGVLLLAFSARDDHRVGEVTLRYRINDGKEREVDARAAGGDAIRVLREDTSERDFVPGVVAIDLARLRRDDDKPVEKDDRLHYYFEAIDSAGHKQRTRADFQVTLVSEEELGLNIQGRQQDLTDAVRNAEFRAAGAGEALATVIEEREHAADLRRASVRAQAAQGRVIDDLDKIARHVAGLLNVYVFNRLDDPSAADQIVPFYERHLLESSARSTVPFRGALYRALHSAQSEKAIRVGDAHLKLIEMADLADRLAVDHGPAAYRAIGSIGTVPAAQRDPAFKLATAEQKTIADGLARLARLIEEWENYESVVRFFRRLRDTEQGIVEDLEGLHGKKK